MNYSYEKEVYSLKDKVLQDIQEILGRNSRHQLNKELYIHYAANEVASAELLNEVSIDAIGYVSFVVTNCNGLGDTEIIHNPYPYDIESLIAVLNQIKDEIVSEKTDLIKDILKHHNGQLKLNGLPFSVEDSIDGKLTEDNLYGISIKDGRVVLQTGNDEEDLIDLYYISPRSLEKIIDHIREKSAYELISLTDEQKKIVERIRQDMTLLSNAGASVIFNEDTAELNVINTNGCDLAMSCEKNIERVEFNNLPNEIVLGYGYAEHDGYFYVKRN